MNELRIMRADHVIDTMETSPISSFAHAHAEDGEGAFRICVLSILVSLFDFISL